jgi:hypothetical protein
MVEDAKKVLHKYKSAIFTAPLPSESGKKAIELCKELNIPYIETTTQKAFFKKNELREILISNAVHCYNAQDNVIYCGNGFLGKESYVFLPIIITLFKVIDLKFFKSLEI